MSTARRLILLPILLFSVLFINACTTTNAYTGQQQTSNSTVGAGIGAVTGALAGQLIGGNTTATLVGAGIGGLVGGVIGDSMDQQETALRQQLQGTGVSVQRVGNDIKLIMPGNITFATNSSDIKSNFYPVLNSVSIVLKKYTGTVVRVAGFTDNTGNANYNQQLSQRRAGSVASYLQSQGVSSGRFSVVGYGQNNPIASNSTAQGREQNRRVEITLQPVN